tara:strand:+ start:25783 stop:27375 length:1593 start_codon:yes stop_codon:yes gene_type:complete
MSSIDTNVSLSPFDWIAVAGYLGIVVGITVWSRFGQKDSSESYFLAGRGMNWIVVAIAIFATLFSTISFVASPGEAYGHGLMMLLPAFAMPIFVPLAVHLFLRFFFSGPTFTAYEYLEKRFNLPTRIGGAVLFCVIRLIYAGVVFYAAAIIIEALVGWPPLLTISAVGLFTIAYTTLGGMKAVMFTDVAQALILIVGISAVFWKILVATGASPIEIFEYASHNERTFGQLFEKEFWTLNFHTRLNVWLLILIAASGPLMSLSCDQLVIQRLLTSKDFKSAKKSVYFNYITMLPLGLLFWGAGLGLFYFYGIYPEKLPGEVTPDKVMGWFISTELPPPIPGLIIAALLAALMSTISSVVNSVATVIYKDGLLRLGHVSEENGPQTLRICRLLSIAAGLVGVGISILLTTGGEGVKSSVLEIAGVWSGLWMVLLSAFLLGVLFPRVSGKAMTVGLVLGSIVCLSCPYLFYYSVPAGERISFNWLSWPGFVVTMGVPLLISLFAPERRELVNLTLRSLKPVPTIAKSDENPVN